MMPTLMPECRRWRWSAGNTGRRNIRSTGENAARKAIDAWRRRHATGAHDNTAQRHYGHATIAFLSRRKCFAAGYWDITLRRWLLLMLHWLVHTRRCYECRLNFITAAAAPIPVTSHFSHSAYHVVCRFFNRLLTSQYACIRCNTPSRHSTIRGFAMSLMAQSLENIGHHGRIHSGRWSQKATPLPIDRMGWWPVTMSTRRLSVSVVTGTPRWPRQIVCRQAIRWMAVTTKTACTTGHATLARSSVNV